MIEKRALREAWPFEEVIGRGGRKRLFAVSNLPHDVQGAVLLHFTPTPAREKTQPTGRVLTTEYIESAWQCYDAASEELKAVAGQRAKALHAVETLLAHGERPMVARAMVVAQMKRDGMERCSAWSLWNWAGQVNGAPRDAWPALLVSAYVGRTVQAKCNPQVWDWYKGHYLTRAQPSHASTYRRLKEMATAQGWSIPSAKTLERRLDNDVSPETQTFMRTGKLNLPTQLRDTRHFAAGEAVNGDGLKFDRLWVRFEDGEILNTATAWFWQDLRTRRILAWRLGKTEHTDLFRLATYDLTGVCAPKAVWVDNTRVAANKLMTAGAEGRHRFKSDPEDGLGMLLMLGITPHFTNADKEVGNPGAKPIERAFGIGGLHSEVATNPRFIQRGYSQATAIDVAELREVIALEVARNNAREGRRTQACRGVLSFDQAWDEAIGEHPVRVLSESQRRLLLTCREVVRVDRSGFVSIKAGRGPSGQNRYWCEHLPKLAGKKVVVHYDPEYLPGDAHLYGLDGRYLCAAQHQASQAFDNKAAGAEHNKLRQRVRKLQKKTATEVTRMDRIERENLYQAATDAPLPEPPQRKRGNVVKANFRQVPDPKRDAQRDVLQRTGTDDTRDIRLGDFMEAHQRRLIAETGWTPPET